MATMYIRDMSKVGEIVDPKERDSLSPDRLKAIMLERLKARLLADGFDVTKPIGKKRYNTYPDDWYLSQPPDKDSIPLEFTK